MLHAFELGAGYVGNVRIQSAAGKHDCIVLRCEVVYRDVLADVDTALDVHAAGAHLLDLAIDHVTRQTELGNALIQHPARHFVLFVDRDGMTHAGQLASRGQTGDTGTDNRNFLVGRLEDLRHHDECFICPLIARRTFGVADRDGIAVAFPTVPAFRLTWARTDPTEHVREDVVTQVDPISVFEIALVNRF